MKKLDILIIAVLLSVAFLLRMPLLLQGFFAFTFDQGRDLLEVEKIVFDKDLKLIGPTTGLPGIFYGPWWYYYISPIFLISGGNPTLITASFGLVGTITVLACYLFVKQLTKNKVIAFSLGLSAAMSQVFITYSSLLWSPSLVLPLMVVYLISLSKLVKKSSKKWLFFLGLTCGFVFDSEAAFGIILIISTILTALLVKRKFVNSKTIYFPAAILLIVFPRIIFDLKNNFLITKSVILWLTHPAVYQEKLGLLERLVNRLKLFNHNFAQTFTQSNEFMALVFIIFISLVALKVRSKLKKDPLFVFLALTLIFIYFGFTMFPDAVWDYYLVGLPAIFIAILSLIFKYAYPKFTLILILFFLIFNLANFNMKLFSPFSITWEGDGAIYRNQKNVLDSVKNHFQGDYSLYVYTPSRFDYPFDYLISWYSKKGLIDKPKENQKTFFLIIRDDLAHSYLPTGWYGDKTKNKSKLVEHKEFTGNIIFEKHERHD